MKSGQYPVWMKENSGTDKESCCLVFPKREMRRPRNRIARNPHSSKRWLQLFISFSVFTAFLVAWPQAISFPEAAIICPCAWVSCFKTKMRVMREMWELCILYFFGKSGGTQIDLKSWHEEKSCTLDFFLVIFLSASKLLNFGCDFWFNRQTLFWTF